MVLQQAIREGVSILDVEGNTQKLINAIGRGVGGRREWFKFE
jgi:hypothetical protein